ncbi:MAG: hypothetical protein KGQ52_03690 [Alphaproteobacteria bacterium]|nr:hypothetical protein [Alphaproteobacteria bacterium]
MALPPATTLRRAGWGLAAAILVLPALAMPFTAVDWGPGDFAAAALLLGLAGLGLEVAARLPRRRWRSRAALLVLAALLLVWAELAVGIVH